MADIAKARKEIEKAVRIARSIPGMYGRKECEFLYKLSRRKGNLVELGCWMGRTTALMLQASKVWEATLTTVDSFSTTQPGIKVPATPAKWRNYLRKAGLEPPELLAMTTREAAKIYDREISMLFIDADHAYEEIKRDLEDWTPKIKVGGYLALHDMFFPSVDGVCRAVVEWWLKSRWAVLGQVDYTIAFRRRK